MPYKDKAKQRNSQHKHYVENKAGYSVRNRTRRAERKKWFFETVLKYLSCSKCPESDPVTLEFHHLDPLTKDSDISRMVNEFRSKESILAEIQKCIVVCANCHRKIHATQERNSVRR
jgi:hypothetical protein